MVGFLGSVKRREVGRVRDGRPQLHRLADATDARRLVWQVGSRAVAQLDLLP
jgi:hypothetical protein